MRIISDQKDFYDLGMSAGVDRSIVYVRETKEIVTDAYREQCGLRRAIIGFCGKTYPIVYDDYRDKNYNKFYRVFYNLNSLRDFVEKNSEYQHGSIFSRYSTKYGEWAKFTKHFDYNTHKNYCHEFFTKYNVPIFISFAYDAKIILNPILRPWHFYTVVDPWTAFQELSMYVGGVLTNAGKEIPPMKDEDMASIKGFNKYSFRKDKATK